MSSLNVKDFPFVFSISTLFYPNILFDSTQMLIMGVLLIVSILGSILTITNPLLLLIRWVYKKKYFNEIIYQILPDLINKNKLINNICVKNFNEALSSPSISFEINKTITLLYFIIILIITIIHSFMYDFTNIFEDFNLIVIIIRIICIVGIISVTIVLINNVFGINFRYSTFELKFINYKQKIRQQTSLSLFDKICIITTVNLTIDFANLANEINKSSILYINGNEINDQIFLGMNKINNDTEKMFSTSTTTSLLGFKEYFEKNTKPAIFSSFFYDPKNIQDIYTVYKSVKRISWSYNVTFSQALSWFYNRKSFQLPELYEMESQIKRYVETKDWYNTSLLQSRIIDKITFVLEKQNLPLKINENWNRKKHK